MGKRGPAPESNVVRLRKGRPILNVPQVVSGVPECPVWLEGEAREMWMRVTPELGRLELVGYVDVAVLESFCQAYGRWREAQRLIDEQGLTMRTQRGFVKNPATSVARSASDEMRAAAVQLGLTPAARQRMVKPEAGDAEAETVFGG